MLPSDLNYLLNTREATSIASDIVNISHIVLHFFGNQRGNNHCEKKALLISVPMQSGMSIDCSTGRCVDITDPSAKKQITWTECGYEGCLGTLLFAQLMFVWCILNKKPTL